MSNIYQFGEKSVSIEHQHGTIQIHSPNGEIQIFDPKTEEGFTKLRKEFGEKLESILELLNKETYNTSISDDEFLSDISRFSENFEGRDEDKKFILDFTERDSGLLYVTGIAGIGKSSLAAKVYKNLSDFRGKIFIIPYFIKKNTASSKNINLFSFLNEELEKVVRMSLPIKGDINQLIADLRKRLKSVRNTNTKVILIIDGLDELESNEGLANLPHEIFDSVTLIYFTRHTDAFDNIRLRGTQLIKLEGLDRASLQILASRICNEFNLSKSIEKQIIRNSQGNPKYLELLRLSIKNESIIIDGDATTLPIMPTDTKGNSINLFSEFYDPLLKKYAQNKDFGKEIEGIIRVLTVAKDYLTAFQIRSILKHDNYSTVEGALPFIKEILLVKKYGNKDHDYHFQLLHESLREYVTERFEADLVDDQLNILSFCRGWKSYYKKYKHVPIQPKYIFRYYTDHLKDEIEVKNESEDKEELLNLAMNDEYIDTQLTVLQEHYPSFKLIEYATATAHENKLYTEVAILGKKGLYLHSDINNQLKILLRSIKNNDFESLKKVIAKINNTSQNEQKELFNLLLLHLLFGAGQDNPNKLEIIDLIIDKVDITHKDFFTMSLILKLLKSLKELEFNIQPFYESVATTFAYYSFDNFKNYDKFLENFDVYDEAIIDIYIDLLSQMKLSSKEKGDDYVIGADNVNSLFKRNIKYIYNKALTHNISYVTEKFKNDFPLHNFDILPQHLLPSDANYVIEIIDGIVKKANLPYVDENVSEGIDFESVCLFIDSCIESNNLNSARMLLNKCLSLLDNIELSMKRKTPRDRLVALRGVMEKVFSLSKNENLINSYLKAAHSCIEWHKKNENYNTPYDIFIDTLSLGVSSYPYLRPIILDTIVQSHSEKIENDRLYRRSHEQLYKRLFSFTKKIFGNKSEEFDVTTYESIRKIIRDNSDDYHKLIYYEETIISVYSNHGDSIMKKICQDVVDLYNSYENNLSKQKEWGSHPSVGYRDNYVSVRYIGFRMRIVSNIITLYYFSNEVEHAEKFTKIFFNDFEKVKSFSAIHLGNVYDGLINLFRCYDSINYVSNAKKLGIIIFELFKEKEGGVNTDVSLQSWLDAVFTSRNRGIYINLFINSIELLYELFDSPLCTEKYLPILLKQGYVLPNDLILNKKEEPYRSSPKREFVKYAKLYFHSEDYINGYSYLEKYLSSQYGKSKISIQQCTNIAEVLLNQFFAKKEINLAQEFYEENRVSIDENVYYSLLAFYYFSVQDYDKVFEYGKKCNSDKRETLYYNLAIKSLENREVEKAMWFLTLDVVGNDVKQNLENIVTKAVNIGRTKEAIIMVNNYIKQQPSELQYRILIITLIKNKEWDLSIDFYNRFLITNLKDEERACELGLLLLVQLWNNSNINNVKALTKRLYDKFGNNDTKYSTYIDFTIRFMSATAPTDIIDLALTSGLSQKRIKTLKTLLMKFFLYSLNLESAISIIETEANEAWCDEKYEDVIKFSFRYKIDANNIVAIANRISEEGYRQSVLQDIYEYYIQKEDIEKIAEVFPYLTIENKFDIGYFDTAFVPNNTKSREIYEKLLNDYRVNKSIKDWKKLCNWAIYSDIPVPLFSELIKKSIYNKEALGTVCKVFSSYDSLSEKTLPKDYQDTINKILE